MEQSTPAFYQPHFDEGEQVCLHLLSIAIFFKNAHCCLMGSVGQEPQSVLAGSPGSGSPHRLQSQWEDDPF